MLRLLQFIFISTAMLYGSVASAATLVGAFEDYREGEHAKAYQQFEALLPLANPTAALQMSFMTLDEEGTDYDAPMAFALASLAAKWGEPQGRSIAEQIEPHLSPAQLEQATAYRSEIESNQRIFNFTQRRVELTPLRESEKEVVKRHAPRFPEGMAARGNSGWVSLLLLISTDGRVVAQADAGEWTSPEVVGSAYRTTRRWLYQPMLEAEPALVRLDYAHEEHEVEDYLLLIEETWELARKGSPGHQYALGELLTTMEGFRNAETTKYDEKLEASAAPQAADYEQQGEVVTWPRHWSGAYWLSMAARNGNADAQWSLAVLHEEWMRYLVEQDDVRAKTWYGATLASRAISEEDREYGLQLLRDAQESGDETAIEVASHYFKDSE